MHSRRSPDCLPYAALTHAEASVIDRGTRMARDSDATRVEGVAGGVLRSCRVGRDPPDCFPYGRGGQ